MGNKASRPERNSPRQTALLIACKTGNVAAVREILEWRDDDGERIDISAKDENGQTALSIAKQSNNAEIVAMIEQNLFLRAVENCDTKTVKTYLTPEDPNFKVLYCRAETNILTNYHEHNSEQMEIQSCEDDLIEETPPNRFKVGFEEHFTPKDLINNSVWLEAVDIAQRKCHDEMLNLLFNDDHYFDGSNDDGQNMRVRILHQLVAEYLVDSGKLKTYEYDSRKLKTIEILLKSRKFSANFLNLKNETIFEILCKIKTKYRFAIHVLLLTFLQNGINLNDTNKNGETLFMLACKNKRIDIVRSLLNLDSSHKFVLDIDAVDNSGETALMKAKRNNNSKIVAVLLERTIMSAYENVKEDAILKDGNLLLGFIEDDLTTFYDAVAEYLEFNYHSVRMKPIEILLKYWKFNANVLNLKNEAILEIICKMEPGEWSKIDDLLTILLQNGIDLNGRNKKGQTFLMLACKNNRIEMVRSLIEMASREFILDIDAVDNSGETAFMKAKERNFSKIVVLLLRFQLISAVKLENADIVKSMLPEFQNTLDIFVRSWSSNKDLKTMLKERETKSDIWLEAISIAMENDTKHSEEILKLLFDCDIHLNKEISFYQLMHGWQYGYDKKLRLTELLLKSGKINVNDRDQNGGTALHWAEDEKLTSLFIRYGADVSRKDNKGKTPLMPISDDRAQYESFPVLRTLLEEAGTLMNLDSGDCNGRTALIHAVMFNRSHDVELLLNKGASVNLSDHLGFTALHHALYGDICQDVEFWRNSEELKKTKEIDVLLDTEQHVRKGCGNEWSEERMKIVEMLLQRPDIDVNLLSIDMFSPLDIAEGQIPEIPPSIRNALKEKGAVLNVYTQSESQSSSDFHLDFTCKLTLILRQLNKAGNDFSTERWLALIETFMEQKVLDKDQRGRTGLHLFAISSYTLLLDSYCRCGGYGGCITELANGIVDKLISIGCSVNERDNFGRTPLHYANETLWHLFISKGADASITDTDGNIAIDKTSRRFSDKNFNIVSEFYSRNDETYLIRLMNNKQMEINVQRVDGSNGDIDSDGNCIPEKEETVYIPRLLWEKGEYAFRHPLFETIAKDVKDMMDAIAKEIERLDPRFEIRVECAGSFNEGTKLKNPDEFDFCFVLTKISELCEVSHSSELPTGFSHLKRRPKNVGEASDFDSFFGAAGILNTVKLNWQFATILRDAMANIENQQKFEWILKTRKYPHISKNITKVLSIEMIKPLNFFTVDIIPVDIVPCIHVDGWWPDDAISNVTDEIKKFGCNLICDSPRELYPWVPYSESCARISFAKAESDVIKKSCDSAKEAYMIGKTMVGFMQVSKYILKNSLLYCIEALTPSSEKASQLGLSLEEMKSTFEQMDRYLWLKCLLKCHLEFVAQDFCPCYFLPNFCNCSVTETKHHGQNAYLKQISFDWIADRSSEFPLSCKKACAFYRCASNDSSESSYQLPAPDPLWERFDRKQLIASLCEIAYK